MVVSAVGPMVGAVAVPPGSHDKPTTKLFGFVLEGAYSVVGGSPTGTGEFKNGNAGPYPEGACVPSLVEVRNTGSATDSFDIVPYYDYQGEAVGVEDLRVLDTALTDPEKDADDLNDFTFSSSPLSVATSFKTDLGGTVAANVSGPFSGASGSTPVSGSDTVRHYNVLLVDVPGQTAVRILMCAKLGVDASEYGKGASMSVRLGDGGAENIAMQAQQLLVLPSLTLRKVVVGSATPDQWSFTVTPSVNGESSFPIPSGEDSVTIGNISPDGSYTVAESGPSGYEFTSGSGENCVFNGDVASATVAASKPPTDATCVFTNTEIKQPKLTVIKTVVNDDGGTAVVVDFPLSIDGKTVLSGVQETVSAGAHAVGETGSAGYDATFGGDCDASGNVTVANGEEKTCTITNDDKPAQLTVRKVVVNDDGGDSVPSDFYLTVTGTDVSLGSFPGSSDGTVVTLDAGAYGVDETDSLGYSKDIGVGCSGTIGVGESRTCMITNDDPPVDPPPTGTLIVTKQVVNDDGGTLAAGNFTIRVVGNGPTPTSFLGSTEGTTVTIEAGDYSVSEDAVAGYVASYSDDCSGVIAADETKRCVVTNDDVKAKLLVKKIVIDDHDGAKTSADFTMNVTGTDVSLASFPGSASGTEVTLDAGTYGVDEADDLGYAKTIGAGCSGTIGVGEERTCTITNEYQAPDETGGTLTVTKVVTNDDGGTLTVSDFPLFVDDASVTSGVKNTVSVGAHVVSETTRSGYVGTFGGDCDSTGSVTVNDGEDKTCTITNDDPVSGGGTGGDDETQTTLTVTKVVTNNDGGTLAVSDFPLFVDGNAVSSGVANTVATGTHKVTETSKGGYVGTFGGDCDSTGSVTVNDGESKTCTITNDDPAPNVGGGQSTGGGGSSGGSSGGSQAVGGGGGFTVSTNITVVTHVVNDRGGNLTASAVTLDLDSGNPVAIDRLTAAAILSTVLSGSESGTTTSVDPGGYSVAVTSAHQDYDTTYGTDCNGTIMSGQTKVCTVTLDQKDVGPAPAVLGVSDEAASDPSAPQPMVLGASDELPRTGLPPALLLAPLVLFAVLKKKR